MTSITAGLVLGLLGSFHCLGMCGPLAMAIPHKSTNSLSIAFESIIYNLGRVLTYSLMGLILGIAGTPLRFAGIQEYVSVICGVLMLAYLVIPKKNILQFNGNKLTSKFVSRLKIQFQNFFKSKSLASLLILGIINGLLPCGLVYTALIGSFASESIFESAIYMSLFGLGTLPMMSVVYFSKNMLSMGFRKKLTAAIPYGVAVIAVVMILRGLSLDIPYLSPKLPDKAATEVPACCK